MDGQTAQQLRIEERGALHYVGFVIRCENGDTSGIGKLWDLFFSAWEQIQGRRDIWGLSLPVGVPGSFDYMACCEVDPAAYEPEWSVPEGMGYVDVDPARYAIIPFEGTPMELPVAIRRFFAEILPANGLSPMPGNAVFEYYPPDCYDEGSNTFKCELLIQIQ